MFDTLPVSHLATMLTHFAFPMLIAERPDPTTEFRIVAVNAALEEITGPKDEIGGIALRDVFPTDVVDEVVQFFGQGDAHEDMQQFSSVICGMTAEVPCDLTLRYLHGPDGYDRVIATAHEARRNNLDLQDKLAFEDVRYFSFIADLQLENLNCAFVSATEHLQVAPIDEERIMRLHAVCRTIQRTVSDIKSVVQQAQARHAPKNGPPNTQKTAALQCDLKNSNMFNALTSTEQTIDKTPVS